MKWYDSMRQEGVTKGGNGVTKTCQLYSSCVLSVISSLYVVLFFPRNLFCKLYLLFYLLFERKINV